MLESVDWKYVGEGGKHALFAYLPGERDVQVQSQWIGRLLRIDKKYLAQSSAYRPKGVSHIYNCEACEDHALNIRATEAQHDNQLEDPIWFLRRVMKPHLGQYLDLPEEIELSWSFLKELKEATLKTKPCPIPDARKNDWVSQQESDNLRPDSAMGWIVRDYRVVSDSMKEDESCLSVEIKPKAGYRACSPLVHPKRRSKYFRSRFVLLQELDRLGYGKNVRRGWKEDLDRRDNNRIDTSRYDPLDLFSMNPDRIRKALENLWDCPQNNLKIWYSPPTTQRGKSYQIPRLLVADKHLRSTLDEDSFKEDCGSVLRDYLSFKCEPSNKDVSKTALILVLSSIIEYEEDFFRKVLQWQQLDVLDGDGAVLVYQRLIELCHGSHEDAQRLLDYEYEMEESVCNSNFPLQSLQASPFRAPSDKLGCPAFQNICEELNRFSRALELHRHSSSFLEKEHVTSRTFCMQQIGLIESKEACRYLLQNWLLSLVMCDISFFITLHPIHDIQLDTDTTGIRSQRQQLNDQMATWVTLLQRQTENQPGLIRVTFQEQQKKCTEMDNENSIHEKPTFTTSTLQYKLKSIDCDIKPSKKLKDREQKETLFQYLQEEL